MTTTTQNFINEDQINSTLAANIHTTPQRIHEILNKALTLQGLNLNETAALINVDDPELEKEIFATARQIKEAIYGKRLVLFAPLYIANYCSNNCLYCAFRTGNKDLKRSYLQPDEIIRETEAMIKQGHKRIVLLTGEAYPNNDFGYVTEAMKTIYGVKCGNGAIRRINVEVAPLDIDDFKKLKASNIGTYIVFQETYHQETYRQVHLSGKKADYNWRVTVMDRAMQAGIDDVGLGVLFGLADWRFEVLALLQHANHLQDTFGVGPHTISVPRLEPAFGSELSQQPLHPVSDHDFTKIVAILRLAVPYTGMIMSTRESPEMRRTTLTLGISQISAGSHTDLGGYTNASTNPTDSGKTNAGQFSLGDHRSLDEVVYDIASLGYFPSFCTACYRLGRTGEDFMCLAKPGKIKDMCRINSLITFYEYLLDYASPKTRELGEQVIQKELSNMPPQTAQAVKKSLDVMLHGKRDLYV